MAEASASPVGGLDAVGLVVVRGEGELVCGMGLSRRAHWSG